MKLLAKARLIIGMLVFNVCGIVALSGKALSLSPPVRGALILFAGLAWMYSVTAWEFREEDSLLRRALFVNPGGLLIFAGIGTMCVGYPESFGAFVLAGVGSVSCMFAGGAMFLVQLSRYRRAAVQSDPRSTS